MTLGVDGDLVRSIKEQLDRGTSLGDIASQLAGSLAASVAAQLGISTQSAHERLTQAFTAALQPTGTGPPQTNAERASSLVSRFRQIAELATRVTNGDTGQPIRLIAGQRSDAEQAKATPPLPPDLTGSASDGRTVVLPNGTQAIATGGDTPLGRILARALLAVDRTGTASSSNPGLANQNDNANQSGIANAGGVASTTGILGSNGILSSNGILGSNVIPSSNVILSSSKDESQSSRSALTLRQAQGDMVSRGDGAFPSTGLTATASASATANGNAAVEAFVTAFASALARDDGPPSRDTAKAPTPASADASTPPISLALPLVKDTLEVAQSTPATTLPQPQHVDANAVVDQILRGVAIRTSDGQSEVRLRLVPEALGDVSVKLVVSGGSVDASITAHTADAQNALAGAQAQLAKTFADAGLKLQSFTVALAGGGFADPRDPSRQNDGSNRTNLRRIGGVGALALDPSDDALLAIPSFAPPRSAVRALPGTLNYLA